MSVTHQQSAEVAYAATQLEDHCLEGARLRAAHFDFVQHGDGDAGSTIDLVTFAPGRTRVIPSLSYFNHTAFGDGTTLDIGLAGFTARDGTAIAAACDCIEDGREMSTAAGADTALGHGTNAVPNMNDLPVDSQGRVTVQAKIATGSIPDGARLFGFLVCTRD